MKSLSTDLANELARTDGPRIRWLVEITASDGTVRRLCTDTRTIDGSTFDGELLSVAPVYEAPDRLADLTIEVPDTSTNRAVVHLAADVRLLTWAEGVAYADADLLFRGDISDPIKRAAGKLRFDAVARADRHDRVVAKPISVSEFPGADPDAVGRMKPVIYGAVADAPCLPIDAGAVSKTVAAMDKNQTSIEVTDASRLPNSGTAQVDVEKMDYTGKSGNTLTGLTRGVGGTTPAEHDRGATLAEIQTQYDYLVAGHPVKSLANLKVDGVRQLGTDFELHPDDGKGRAIIRFLTRPTIERNVNLVANDTIAVDDGITIQDGIEVNDDIAVGDNIDVSATTSSTRQEIQETNSPDAVRTVDNGSIVCYSYVGFSDPGAIDSQTITIIYDIQFTYANPNTGDAIYVDVNDGNSSSRLFTAAFNGSEFEVNSSSTGYLNTGGTDIGVCLSTTTSAITASIYIQGIKRVANVIGSVTPSKSGGAYKASGSAYRQGSVGRSGAASKVGTVTLEGNSVADAKIGGQVTVDVEGWADDASGTITGTAGALIERPDQVLRHALRTYGGASGAETAAGDFDAFTGDALAFRVTDRRRVRELVRSLAHQSRALAAYSGGRWIFRRRPGAAPTPDLTLTDSDIIREEDGASTIEVSHVGLRRLANRIEWRTGRQPDDAWVATGTDEDTTSQGKYGLRERSEDLDAVPTEAQGQALIDWMLPRTADPTRRLVTLQALLTAYELEVGDIARIDSAAMGIDVTGEVVAIGPRVLTGRGAGAMTLTVEEAG